MEILSKMSFVFDRKNKEKTFLNLQKLKDNSIVGKSQDLSVTYKNDFPLDENTTSQICQNHFLENVTDLHFENFFKFDGKFFSKIAKSQKHFSKLRSLFLNNVHIANVEMFLDFFTEKNIENLKLLGLSNTNINDNFLILLSQKNFKNLTVLNLNSSFGLTSAGFLDFFDSKMAVNLKSLSLQNMEINNRAIFALCFAENCNNIEELDLSLCSALDDIAYLNILMSPNLKNLQKIHLFNTMVTSRFLLEFDQRSLLKNLRVLRMEENYGVKSEAYGCIGTSPLFQNLEHLQISMSDIDDVNFIKIYDSPYLKNLKTLVFYDNGKISRACLKEFAVSTLSKNIENLDLSWLDLDDSVLISLGKSETLKNLKILKIANCRYITAEGFVKFMNEENAQNLEKMHFTLTKINDKVLEVLMKKIDESLMKIKEIDIRKCENISKEQIEKLVVFGNTNKLIILND